MRSCSLFSLLIPCVALNSYASTQDSCLLNALKNASEDTTVAQLKQRCSLSSKQKNVSLNTTEENEITPINDKPNFARYGLISSRFDKERQTQFDSFVITPHHMNYILPAYYTTQVNEKAYSFDGDWAENLTQLESKFQISLKVPLTRTTTFITGDGFYFGMTLEAWWQVFSDNISKPFRETNYRPEFFYIAPMPFHPFEGNTGIMIGAEHQSNGRSQRLSRSWNRTYVNFLYEKDNFALSFKPYWRLPEKEKETPFQSDGDDNPDISDYMGHYELGIVYKWNDYELGILGRENFATHKGAFQLGFTFPLSSKLRGYAQYFSGYGESLIDYNHNQQRFGIGVALNSLL